MKHSTKLVKNISIKFLAKTLVLRSRDARFENIFRNFNCTVSVYTCLIISIFYFTTV